MLLFVPASRFGKIAIGTVPVLVAAVGLLASRPHLHPAPSASPTAVAAPTEGVVEPSRSDRGCPADVSHPIRLRVTPLDPARPGAVARARIEFESRMLLDDVRMIVTPMPGLSLESARERGVGLLSAGDRRLEMLAVRLPMDAARRTVQVTVAGTSDGFPISRSTVWNLTPGGGEPSRVVTTADGRRIREVAGRRID